MIKNGKDFLRRGIWWLVLFGIWTVLVMNVGVKPAGETATALGFAELNICFNRFTGVHMWLYELTDWLGLVPLFICMFFGGVGAWQMIKRKSLMKVDRDILLLGLYYALVIFCYLLFESIPVNYRPILIDGNMEASYPSSTTLLVLCVMQSLVLQSQMRIKNSQLKKYINWLSMAFALAMVFGRLFSGVHWLTDIVASVLLSKGLFCLYRGSLIINNE